MHAHAYADDMQIYGFCLPSDATKLQMQVSACIDEVALWMQSNRLQLNTAKTEILWCTTNRRQHLIPETPTRIGDDYITPAASVRDLGIYIDSDVSMKSHVSRTVSTCFAALRQIRSIRHCVPRQALVSLVVSLVLSRVDYGNATLAGLPAYAISRLQSALNAAARLVFSLQKYDSVTLLLQELHWLKVEQRIEYKLAVLVHRCLHGTAPPYLANDFRRVADLGTRRRLRSASTPALVVPPSRLSTDGDRAFPVAAARVCPRTVCQISSRRQRRCPCSSDT